MRSDELPKTFDDEHMNHQYQQLCATWLKIQTKPQQRNSGHPGHCLWLQNKHYVLFRDPFLHWRGKSRQWENRAEEREGFFLLTLWFNCWSPRCFLFSKHPLKSTVKFQFIKKPWRRLSLVQMNKTVIYFLLLVPYRFSNILTVSQPWKQTTTELQIDWRTWNFCRSQKLCQGNNVEA